MAKEFLKVRSGVGLRPGATPSDPTNGDFYYDSGTNTFKFRQNGSWSGLTSSAANPVWTKYTFSHTAFQVAATSTDLELLSLPTNGMIQQVIVKHSTQFTGTGITAYTVSVGTASNFIKYTAAFNVNQTVSDTARSITIANDIESFSSSTSIRIRATSTGADLDQSTAGSVDIWVLTSVLPFVGEEITLPTLPVAGATYRWNAHDFDAVSGGTTVSSWTDSIGGKILTTGQGTPQVQTNNGYKCVKGHKASAAWMSTDWASTSTWAAVIIMNTDTGSANTRFWNTKNVDTMADVSSGVELTTVGANEWYEAYGAGSFGVGTVTDNSNGVWVLSNDGVNLRTYWNGRLLSTTGSVSSSYLYLFCTFQNADASPAAIHEMVLYTGTTLSAADVASYQVYAAANWNSVTEVTWQNINNATATGNDIVSSATGSPIYAASATTVETITGDGYFEWTGMLTTDGVGQQGGGLTNDANLGASSSYANIDYAILGIKSGTALLRVYELGTWTGVEYGPFLSTDVFRVTKTGTTVTYSKNGTVFYTSAVSASSGPYRGGFTANLSGAQITNAVMQQS